MLATITSIPELELDKEEAAKLSKATQEVGKHYSIMINPKWVAITNLGAVAGFLYIPRIVTYRERTKRVQELQTPKIPPMASTSPNASPIPTTGESKTQTKIPIPPVPSKQMSPSEIYGPQDAEEFPGLG